MDHKATLKTIRSSFPMYAKHPDLVYLDSAATALKPQTVITAQMNYYTEASTNIARGIYPLAEQATALFEETRALVASFIGANKAEEIIFTAGTTASLNLAADLLASRIHPGDNIVVTAAEHHSNFLPWKELAKKNQAELRTLPVNADSFLALETLEQLIDSKTKIFAFSAVSNVLGVINPVKDIVARVKSIRPDILVVVDIAQAIGHISIDVTDWNVDFVAFSGHKIFGPTGIGVLYGKHALLATLAPTAFGGGMVLDACAEETLYKDAPARFEAGTPNIAGVIGLGAAVDFINTIGLSTLREHEQSLIAYTIRCLTETFGDALTIIGTTNIEQKSGIVSFTLAGIHPHDTAHLLGEQGICVRAGLQCAAPLHDALDLSATTRISLSIYNTEDDIEKLIVELKKIRTLF